MHIWKAFSLARQAVADPGKTDEILETRAKVIKQEGEEEAAMIWLNRVLGSDGISASEQQFLSKLEKLLYSQD